MFLKPRFVSRIALLAAITLLIGGCTDEGWRWHYSRRADRFYRAGELEKAKQEYLNLLRVNRGDKEAIARLGLIWAMEGAPLQAYGYLKKTAENNPEIREVHAPYGRILLTFGDVDSARREAETLLENSPLDDEAILLLAETVRDNSEVRLTRQRLAQMDDGNRASIHLARAVLGRREGDQAALEQELKQACAVEPNSARAHLGLAEFLFERGDASAAKPEFDHAAELAPARSEERMKCAEFRIATGETASARQLLAAVTAEAPDYIPAWTMLARAAQHENNLEDALRYVETALQRDVYALEAHLVRNEIRIARGESARALLEMETLDRAFPGVPLVRYHLARANLQEGKLSQAQNILKETVIDAPNFTEAILLLAETNTRLGQGNLAIGSLLDLLGKNPDLPRARALLVDAYESRGYWSDAAALLRDEVRRSPNDAGLYARLGLNLARDRQTDAARDAFENALRIAPGNYDALDALVSLELQRGDLGRAQHYVDEQARISPNSPATTTVEAKIQLAQKQPEEAEASALNALKIQADFAPAADFLASIYVAQGKLEAAVAQLQIVIAQAPQNAAALLTLAQAQDRLGRYDEARDSYEKVLRLNPDSVLALNNLAFLYAERLHQLDRAFELARQARSQQRDDPTVADTLGWVLYRQGEFQQAIRLFEEAANARRNDTDIQFHLGLARYMMGETEAAADALETAEKSPDPDVRNESRSRLELLRPPANEAAEARMTKLHERIARDPDDVIARLQLGDIAEKREEFPAAAEQYRAAIATNPKLLPAQMRLARLYAGPLKDCTKALETATQARALKPYDPVIAGGLGRVAYACGNVDWAASLLSEAVRAGNADAPVLIDYAWATYSLGHVEEAIDAMRKASDLSESAAVNQRFIEMVSAENDIAAAERILPQAEKTLAAEANDVPALMLRARVSAARGQAKAATQMYSRLLERLPEFALAQKRLGELLVRDPDAHAQAYDVLSRARQRLPRDAEVAQLLAELSYERKDYSYAAQLLNESASKRPLNPKLLYYLGVCYSDAKQPYAMRDSLQRALDSGLPEPMAADARRLLAQVTP